MTATTVGGVIKPPAHTVVLNQRGPRGSQGERGLQGVQGPSGDSVMTDPGDLTLIFDNKLI
jgi:hypothetical protein